MNIRNQPGRSGGLVVLMLFLTACATSPQLPEWPGNLPPRAYYESAYAADSANQEHQTEQEYLTWVKRFYSGWGGVRGWQAISKEIVNDAPADERMAIRERLRQLGQRMAAEWAKASGERALTGKTVQVWSNAAYEASAHRNYMELLNQVSQDLTALLAGRLDEGDITLQRYYADAEMPPAVGALENTD